MTEKLLPYIPPLFHDPDRVLYDQFQNQLVRTAFSVGDKRSTIREVLQNRDYRRVDGELTPTGFAKIEPILREILSPKSCREWFARKTAEDGIKPEEWGTLPRPFRNDLAAYAWEQNWDLEKNALKLRLYRLAALEDYFRTSYDHPGELNWRGPSEQNMREVERRLIRIVRSPTMMTTHIANLCDSERPDIGMHPDRSREKEILADCIARTRKLPKNEKNPELARLLDQAGLGQTWFGDIGAQGRYNKNKNYFTSILTRKRKLHGLS